MMKFRQHATKASNLPNNSNSSFKGSNAEYFDAKEKKRLFFTFRPSLPAAILAWKFCPTLSRVGIAILLLILGRLYLYLDNNHALHVSSRGAIGPEGNCEQPSLPRGSIHIVVGGWKRHETPSGVSFSPNREHNYLWDIGLTNADVFWYRRVDEHIPLGKTLSGPCGMKMHERLLLPNHGREASAFLDYVLEFYDRPPRTLIFMHGHVSYAWHTKCDAVMARTAYYYRDLAANPTGNRTARVRNHMMSLTAEAGTKDFLLNWFGWERLDTGRTGPIVENWPFLERWKDVIKAKSPYQPNEDGEKGNPYRSCCANFMVPGERIRRFPREFWEDLRATMVDQSHEDYYMGQDLFEFVIYEFLGDDKEFTREEVQNFYDEADGLAIGNERVESLTVQPDPKVLWRIQNCEDMRMKEYVRIRKVRNTLAKFGITYN